MKIRFPYMTHAAALGFGLLVATLASRHSAASSSAAPTGGAPPRAPTGVTGADGAAGARPQNMLRNPQPPPKLRAAEYRRAWDAIADQDLPPMERSMLQATLLQQWAEVDMEGALTAAFDTSWDDIDGFGGIRQLLAVFSDEFARRPTEAWDLITSGKFGLGATLAKAQWADVVVRENPMLVLNSFRQIPYHTRRSVFPQILEEIGKDPSKIGGFYDKLSELPQDKLYLDMVRQSIDKLGARGTTDEIRSKFLESTTDARRTILVHEFGKSLTGASMDTIRQQLSQLPEDIQGRMLRSVAVHNPPGEQTPQFVELLLKSGEYNEVQGRANEYLRDYAQDPAKQASLAQWSASLPQTPGTAQVIQRSVEPYFAADPDGARRWIETLPANSWNRDVALAEYSKQMLRKHNNPDGSAWALGLINDPQIKQQATNWAGSNTKPR